MERLINNVKIDENTRFEYVTNPKRVGFKAHARYANYQSATNIEEYTELTETEAKYASPDLRYDEEHGFLKLFDAEDVQLNPTEE